MSTPLREAHQAQVATFLQDTLGSPGWHFSLPHGWGAESYFARDEQRACFIKLGVPVARYQVMASLGLTPPLLASGSLPDGTSIIVQPVIPGRSPDRADYRLGLERVAAIIHQVQHSPELQGILPPAPSPDYRLVGKAVLDDIQARWQRCRPLVPKVAGFIDNSLDTLREQIASFQGSGLVASHNDICNANWLVTDDELWYLIDLEAMALGDPALDIGATLWWYYPPDLWPRFLELTGHANEPGFGWRMRVRMAMHCLHILIPRTGSFDRFDPASFSRSLDDFRAALAGETNPQMNKD